MTASNKNSQLKMKEQGGYSILSVLLALTVGSVVAAGAVNTLKYKTHQQIGDEVAGRTRPYQVAVNRYISENYSQLQSNQAISRNGVVIPVGTAEGSIYAPRGQDLINLGYLPIGYSDELLMFGAGTKLRTSLRREPAGCAPENCEIPGYIYLSRPALRNATEINGIAVGKYRVEMGPDALVATNARPAKMVSGHGVEVDNPLPGAPSGAIGVLVGFGSSTYANWLTVNDSRDPNFRGDLTVKGEIKSETRIVAPEIHGSESVGSGKGDDGICNLAELNKNGEIISRISSCLNKVVISPVAATISTFYNNGNKSIEIVGEQGTLTARNSAGKTTVAMNGNTSQLAIISSTDNKSITANATLGELKINNGTNDAVAMNSSGDIRAVNGLSSSGFTNSDGSGRVHGGVANLNSYQVPNSACSSPYVEGDIASSATGNGIVMCASGRWAAVSSKGGVTVGQSCVVNGELGATNSGVALICSGGEWIRLTDRFGTRVLIATYFVSHGTWVSKPACQSGTTGSAIYVVPKSIDTSGQSVNYAAIDFGGSWQTVIQNNLSVATSGEGIAMTYCLY